MKELQEHIAQINELCNAHDVKSLFAFGSVLSGKLNTESDIDLIVDIDSKDPIDYSDNYFAIKFQLENILERQIDLLESKSVKNPFLKKADRQYESTCLWKMRSKHGLLICNRQLRDQRVSS